MAKEELKIVIDLVGNYCGRDTKNTGEVFIDSGAIGINAAAGRVAEDAHQGQNA